MKRNHYFQTEVVQAIRGCPYMTSIFWGRGWGLAIKRSKVMGGLAYSGSQLKVTSIVESPLVDYQNLESITFDGGYGKHLFWAPTKKTQHQRKFNRLKKTQLIIINKPSKRTEEKRKPDKTFNFSKNSVGTKKIPQNGKVVITTYPVCRSKNKPVNSLPP